MPLVFLRYYDDMTNVHALIGLEKHFEDTDCDCARGHRTDYLLQVNFNIIPRVAMNATVCLVWLVCLQPAGAVTTSSLLAVCAIVEGVVGILGSAISCKAICCSSAFTAASSVCPYHMVE